MSASEDGSSLSDIDAQGLQKLGYKPALPRSRGLFHVLFMTLGRSRLSNRVLLMTLSSSAIMSVPYGLSTLFVSSLTLGGPVVMIWCWIIVSVLSQFNALSLAEICSVYPTSAGAYYWCYRLASPKSRLVLSWINGWLFTVGIWTVSLAVAFATAQLLIAGVAIFHPEWVVTPWQTCVIIFSIKNTEDLVFVAVTVFTSIFVLYLNKFLPALDILSACWTLLGIIVILVGFSVKAAAGRRPISFALGHFDPSPSGWTPGWAFVMGLAPPAYVFSSIGMITSMAEEVRHPAVQVPQAMVYSIPIGSISGLLFLLPVVFTLPDIQSLLAVPGGQPTGVMFTLIMGSQAGGFGMVNMTQHLSYEELISIGFFCTISVCCAASRGTWSFARDKAIPFHHIFSRISGDASDPSSVPFNAHLLSTGIQLLLGLLYLGSSAAFNAFSGVAVICLGASYAMPIAILLVGKEGRKKMRGAPFSLGRWGWYINVVALAWILLEIVLFSMPVAIPVDRVTMNYASVVFVGFAAISAGWYFINGRYHYAGPPTPSDIPITHTLDVSDKM
ncbi:Polyamine transporter TPO5 [Termitomyces sp. J132]|nr:Polyamine transporter TPO5 [Termitomyces sp. J132]